MGKLKNKYFDMSSAKKIPRVLSVKTELHHEKKESFGNTWTLNFQICQQSRTI